MGIENTGKSANSPFVYFVSGTPVYPPNNIYESASTALVAAGHKPLRDVLKEFAKTGMVGGTRSVLPEAWWFQFLLSYISYYVNNFSTPEEMEQSAVEALKLMMKTLPEPLGLISWPL